MKWVRSITAEVWMVALAAVLTAAPAFATQNRRFQAPPNQGHHAGQWLRQHRNQSSEQQRRALESDPGFRSLPPQRQQQLRNQLQRFNNLPREQQDRYLNRMETWEHLTPGQKEQARGIYNQWQQLPPDRRQAVKGALQTLRAMPPEARERTINSDAYKQKFSPQERQMLDGASKLPLAPPEPNEEAHPPEE